MKKRFISLMALLWCGCLLTLANSSKILPVIPRPQEVILQKGKFDFRGEVRLWGNLPADDAAVLEDYLHALPYTFKGGLRTASPVEADVRSLGMRLVKSLPFAATSPEAYALTVTSSQITIEALSPAGLFYGLQTLLQSVLGDGVVRACRVHDAPRFPYRGVMLDVSRHFFTKQFVMKQMDAMARFKLNRLHLHLTDAAGWRIEIKKYPRLTQLAAWRSHALWKDWWNGDRKYCEEGTPGAYGGYYTQDDIRELVDYARKRYITVIPEIEMPAHSEEVLTAYPELSCTHEPYKQADFCVGNEKTFEFLENVLTEVMALFPSKYIHIGGDEAAKASWKTCPLCQKRIKDEHLDGVDGLQSYLIHRIEKFLNAHGRQIIGWDEILDGGLAPNATVMSWRGEEGGIKAARMGHHVIMTPGAYCYIDSYQDAPPMQPEAIGGYLPLAKVYSYNPQLPDSAGMGRDSLLTGVQANLWAEYVPTPEHSEYMLYPRVLALSEVAWTRPELKDYAGFRKRVLKAVAGLQKAGYHPFDLKHEYGERKEYLTPVKHKALGKPVAYGKDVGYFKNYAASGDGALTDGLRGGWTNNDGRWQGFIGKAGVDVVVDMGRVMPVQAISAEFMQMVGPEIYFPSGVTISISEDGVHFKTIKTLADTFRDTGKVEFRDYGWQGREKTRYIRYQATKSEKGGWLFTDEIIVK